MSFWPRKPPPEAEAPKPKSASALVAEARARTESLNPVRVAEELERDGMLEFCADPKSSYHLRELDPSRRVILHCAAGGRSALGAATLKQMGYRNVVHLEGGITAWKKQGYPSKGGKA